METMKQHDKRVIAIIIFILILHLSGLSTAIAQNSFLKTYGGNLDEDMHTMIRAHDGGFIMAGSTESFGQLDGGILDGYLVKTDDDGNPLWSLTIGIETVVDIQWITATQDSAYVICGGASDNNGSSSILLAKVDEQGDMLWQKLIQKGEEASGHCVQQLNDGGFILAAETTNSSDLNFLLVKTDSDGIVEWSKEIGGPESEIPYYVFETADGGFLVSGISRYGLYWSHIYTVKTDSTGLVEWQKSYDTFPYFSKCSIAKVLATEDGGYLIAGGSTHNEPLSDIILLKIDSAGNIQWTKAYGGNDAEYCGSIIQNTEGQYVVCGKSASSAGTGYYDALMMMVDEQGQLIKSSVFGSVNADDDFTSIVAMENGGYMVAGNTFSFHESYDGDFMLIQTDQNFNGPSCDTLAPQITETDLSFGDTTELTQTDVIATAIPVSAFIGSGVNDSVICDVATGAQFPLPISPIAFSVYPNPASAAAGIHLSMESLYTGLITMKVLNNQGQLVYSVSEIMMGSKWNKEFSFHNSLPAGIYTIQILREKDVYTCKLVLQP
jgi:hypothetical protein